MRETQSAGKVATIKKVMAGCLLAAGCLWMPTARAQDEEQKGVEQGNYNVKQSIEFGGRFASVGGNTQAYDTFVNLQQGARLLDFTTEMTSLNHHGTLFDRLYFSNFGYGGDPNNVSRLRVSKNKWYNFDAQFRRDENTWDYLLQANPLNPTTPFTNGPAGYGPPACTACVQSESPHLFDTRRRMSDYNLLVRPDSKVRFRGGYSRTIVEGPAFSSIHQGTEQALLEDYKTTVNIFRLGMDFKVLPRTNISYDQLWTFYKGDTTTTDPNASFQVSPTQLVDLGRSFNVGASQPCGGTFLASGFVNPTCSAYFSYFNHGRTRTKLPTEQISLQSNYWKSWDLSARGIYSSGDTNVFGYNEVVFGRESRTNLRNGSTTGPVFGRRVAATAEFGATWHITDKLSFLDSFHYSNWHNPAEFDASSCSFFSANLLTPSNIFSPVFPVPLTCAPPAGSPAGTPVHTTSSGPDLSLLNVSQFLKQDEKTNLAEFGYQHSSRLGGRAGFRYRDRTIADKTFATGTFVFFPNLQNSRTPPAPYNTDAAGNPLTCPVANNVGGAAGPCVLNMPGQGDSSETPIHEYAGVFGVWARPMANWRISFDADLMSADNAFTRISPRQSQEYRARSKYKVASWLNVNGSVTIWEGRNNVFQINDLQHNRTYGISAMIQRSEKWGLDFGYDYNDVFSQVLICYISSVTIGGKSIPGPGIGVCPNVPGLVQQLSTYTNNSNYGYFDLRFTPFSRLTAHLGANLTGTSGSELRLDPQALIPIDVSGPLNSKWLHPTAGFEYKFSREFTGQAYWDYYGYREDPTTGAVIDLFAPRNFRANLATLSVRYAF